VAVTSATFVVGIGIGFILAIIGQGTIRNYLHMELEIRHIRRHVILKHTNKITHTPHFN